MGIGRIVTLGGMALTLAVPLTLGGCANMPIGRGRIVRTTADCADQTVSVYFEPESADITPEGRAVILQAARVAKGCMVRSVEVLGLADATGANDAQANLALSGRRAQSVTSVLTSAGLPAADFKLAAAGQEGAVTASGQTRPLRRRADIILRLSPAK